ncbi:hypothetical protein L1987_01979 [Smallanthus sonchifolius]|uniref:Uncharacterized protein n=1 Tax=Smallanthus sonchifolius TaxID=185202 RepID=A0ACB9K6R0_9ASTR|nr:hypothetical protein L1987_01979 [Smallanthus sonchifolius]
MADSSPNSKFQSMREWVVEHKLRAVDQLLILFSTVVMIIKYKYNNKMVLVASRLHAQALTLAALAGAAVVEYYDHNSGAKSERYAKFLSPIDSYSHKD